MSTAWERWIRRRAVQLRKGNYLNIIENHSKYSDVLFTSDAKFPA